MRSCAPTRIGGDADGLGGLSVVLVVGGAGCWVVVEALLVVSECVLVASVLDLGVGCWLSSC